MPIFIDVKVTPSSGKQSISLDKSGIIKCFLKNPPEKGKANKELINFIAKKLSIEKNLVEIVSGLKSRKKRIKIDLQVNLDKILHTLGVEKQTNILRNI